LVGAGRLERLEDGLCHGGDVLREDGTRQFRFEGRVRDIIVVDGDNVSPAEVEAALMNHPLVWDASVASLTDPTSGEQVVAVVHLANDTNDHLLDCILPLAIRCV
jgi:long-chain acyl-CoA synthetase